MRTGLRHEGTLLRLVLLWRVTMEGWPPPRARGLPESFHFELLPVMGCVVRLATFQISAPRHTSTWAVLCEDG